MHPKKYFPLIFFGILPVHFSNYWLKNLAKALPHPEPSVRAPPHCSPVGREGQSPAQSGRARFTWPVKLGVQGAGEMDLKKNIKQCAHQHKYSVQALLILAIHMYINNYSFNHFNAFHLLSINIVY